MNTGLFTQLLLAIIFGAAIGLERAGGRQGADSIGGMRTYSLIALVGALAGVFLINDFSGFALLISGGVMVLLVAYYLIGSFHTKNFGITSELSVIATFIIGALLAMNIIPLKIIVAIFVLLILILSLKTKTNQIVAGISRTELQSFISYAIIALVIWPFLPDIGFKLQDIPVLPAILQGLGIDLSRFSSLDLINPRRIWMVVVLITGIDVFGYILGRVVGNKKSFALTSFIAGFVSSTSATQSLALKSKKTLLVNNLVGAALLANLASFFQVFLLVGPLNPKWVIFLAPVIFTMLVISGILAGIFLKRREPEKQSVEQEIKSGKIFSLMPALKFAGILIIIKIITKVCLIMFGQSGFVVSAVIASFAGLDAILVTLAEMAGQTITFKFALFAFVLVNATNLLSKTVYAYWQGSRSFAVKFLLSALAIVAGSAVWLLV